jgi:hypothetical protein
MYMTIAVVVVLVLAAGWLRRSPRPRAAAADPPLGEIDLATGERMRAALDRLLRRGGDDAFVVFKDAESGSIVQFAGGDGHLLLDVPAENFSESESERAATFFAAHDVRLTTQPRYSSYQLDFGANVDAAAGLALDIFARVFQRPANMRLRIEEN